MKPHKRSSFSSQRLRSMAARRWALIACLASCVPPVWGQPQVAPSAPTARVRSPGELSRAQRELESAYVRQPSPQLLLELAAIAAAQRELPAAADLYRRALVELPQASTQAIQDLITEQESRGAEVSVVGPEGALLRVDGRLVGILDRALPLLLGPGPRVLELQHPKGTRRHSTTITPGVPISIRFSLNDAVGPAQSETPQVLVIFGKNLMPSPEHSFLRPAVMAGIRSSGQATAVAVERVRSSLTSPEEGCLADSACQYELAQRLGALYILRIPAPSAGPVEIELLDVAVRAVSVSGEATIPADAAAAAVLRTKVEGWIQSALSRPVGEVNLTLKPADAVVQLDGHTLKSGTDAKRPLRLTLFAGRHVLAAHRWEYLPTSQEVEVSPGQSLEVVLTLAIDPVAVKRRQLGVGKWTLLGAGLAAVVAGGVLLGIHDTPVIDDVEGQPKTSYILSQPHGIVTLCFGGLLLGGAGALWGLERRQTAALATRER